LLTLHSVEQADETWLAQFENQISTPWDFTAVHINKNSLAGAKKDIVYSFLLYLRFDFTRLLGPLHEIRQAHMGY
jgi:hypothetical protein